MRGNDPSVGCQKKMIQYGASDAVLRITLYVVFMALSASIRGVNPKHNPTQKLTSESFDRGTALPRP